MRRLAIALLLLTPRAPAQVVVAPGELARVKRLFEPHVGEEPLRCDVTPVAPALNFAFRFRAGYTFHIPQSQYPGSTRGWAVLTAIAPEEGDRTYLFARIPLSSASKADLNFDIRGVYFLGVGRYSVESAILDDRNRVCRKQWQIVVEPSRANRSVPLAMAPNAVLQYSAAGLPDTKLPESSATTRLSILVNAAAFSTRGTVIRPYDRSVLLGALTALLEHLPAASVRLVVFSLEQQREVFRAENFSPPDLTKAADAIRSLEQTTVDVHVLEKPLGHVDFLAGLIARERDPLNPADTIVFLGPTSRYGNKIPEALLPTPHEASPRFFYVRYETQRRPTPSQTMGRAAVDADQLPPLASELPVDSTHSSRTPANTPSMMPPTGGQTDIIAAAVARLKGKTLTIRTPADLAGAIRKIEGKR